MANIFDRITDKIASTNKLNKQLYGNWYNAGMVVTPGRNYNSDLIEGYLDNAVLYSIINKIARPASDVPLTLTDLDGGPLTDHWANKLIKAPNQDTTMSELIFNYYVYLLSIGNSFIYSPKLGDGRSVELWTAPSEITQVIAGDWKHPVQGYEVVYGEVADPIAKADMLHSKLFNPRFGTAGSWLYGLSPIAVASELIRNLNAGDKRMQLMAERGGPPFIISAQLPEGLTESQQELLEATYDRKYTGTENTNKPFLSGIPLKVAQTGSTASDLDLVTSSEHAIRILCNVYGISSVLLNDNSNSTFNNIVELKKDLYTSTIIPLNNIFAEKLTNWLLLGEDAKFSFNYENVEVLSASIDNRMKTVNEISFIDDNEKRIIFDYPERETIKPQDNE